jgi:hypothetical protein
MTKYINSSNPNKRPLTLTDKSTSTNNPHTKPHPPRPKNPENDKKPYKNPLTHRQLITKPQTSSNLDSKPISQKAILKNISCYDLSLKSPYQESPKTPPTPGTPDDSSIDKNRPPPSPKKKKILIKTNLNDSGKCAQNPKPQQIFSRKIAALMQGKPDQS